MGIDVYTTSLANQLRNLDRNSADALLASPHPLTSESTPRWPSPSASNVGLLGAVMLARQLAPRFEVTHSLNPVARLGPMFVLALDRIDPRAWAELRGVLQRRRAGVSLESSLQEAADDDDDGSYFSSHWDDVPGIGFARAASAANSMVMPGGGDRALVAGAIAVSFVAEADAFFASATELLAIGGEDLAVDHDEGMSEPMNRVLYNLRLLWFHVREAERSGSVLGIWG